MNWKIIPSLACITLFNLAVSCIDDLFSFSPSSGGGLDAAFVAGPEKVGSSNEEALQEIFPGGEFRWDKDGGIVLAIIREGEAHALFHGRSAEEDFQ